MELPVGELARPAEPRPLAAGEAAPDFVLHRTPDQTVALSDFRGRSVVLAFHPSNWSPLSSEQMALFREILPELRRLGAELLVISVDTVWCHLAFAREHRLEFPLLADFEPKGAVARSYGVYRDADGVSERALFVIDGNGVIRWSYVAPDGINPGADGILTTLEMMQRRGEAR